LRSWLVSLLGKRSAASTGSGLDPLSFSLRGFVRAIVFQRRYRMDATILLLGAPLFTRAATGGAYASVEECRELSECRPRSFLRPTFEAELEATQPSVPSVFQEGSA
jgi:hypothetical protein